MKGISASSIDKIHILTDRDIDLIKSVADGDTNLSVAKRLWVSEATVRRDIRHLFKYYSVENRTELVVEAIRNGDLLIDFAEKEFGKIIEQLIALKKKISAAIKIVKGNR